ncbi:MAG: T9SS type A sorting domain-containing protein [Ignavibacteria bacterium]|nr:T9SS type A sorting domain-containing protein [Ignavibacteria bacterium]
MNIKIEFNPVTTIKYQIPEAGLVSLKVYNILGEAVATLVNEIKRPGSYTVDFNSGKLASGVYFYELSANHFRSTKKFLLMK